MRELGGESCPARVNGWVVHANGVAAFNLAADHVRAVSATIEIQTDTGWDRFNVPTTDLRFGVQHWYSNEGSWTLAQIQSVPFYVRLPRGSTKVESSWIASAQGLTPADPWYSAGVIACAPYVPEMGGFFPNVQSTSPETGDPDHQADSDNPLIATPPASAKILQAQPVAAPEYSCAHPFSQARAVHLGRPQFPRGYVVSQDVTSEIQVDVLPSGSIGTVRVFKPTGSDAFDQAALDAVNASSFAPARAFCKPANGMYLFLVTFGPGHP